MAEQRMNPSAIPAFRLYRPKEKDQYIGDLVSQWEKDRKEKASAYGPLPFVTISREFGCMALETGLRLVERLSERDPALPTWKIYDREIVEKIAEDLWLNKQFMRSLTESHSKRVSRYMDSVYPRRSARDQMFQETVRVVRGLCEKGHTVVIGRAACKIAEDLQEGFHVRIVAPLSWRIEQVAFFYKVSREEAKRRIRLVDAGRKAFFEGYLDEDILNPELYDIVLNQGRLAMDLVVDMVVCGMEGKGLLKRSIGDRRRGLA